jgi:hypothetical protein
VGAWTWAGIITILAIIWLIRRWTKSGTPPPTSLKCLNCPKLVERNRQLIVLAVGLGLAEAVTLVWLAGVWGAHH